MEVSLQVLAKGEEEPDKKQNATEVVLRVTPEQLTQIFDSLSLGSSLGSTSRVSFSNAPTPAAITHVVLHCGPQNFIPYRPRPQFSVAQLLQQKLWQPLGKEDQKSGYVYIYWNPGNFGYVKIGYTSFTVEKRLNEWNRGRCGHGAEKYSDEKFTCRRVPHVRRVEALMFAELRDYRLRELSCPCRTKHEEWFHVSPIHAAEVREKIENFVLKEARYETRVGGRFLHQNVSDADVAELCRPLELAKPVSPNAQKALKSARQKRVSERLRRKS
jgi:T5orf172 domain